MIQAVRNFVNLEQVIKGSDEVGWNNIGDDLESEIKEDRGDKGGDLETVGKEDFYETVEQEGLETVGQEDSAPPKSPAPPIIIQQKSGHPSCYVGTSYQ